MNRAVAYADRALSRVIAFAERHTKNAAFALAAFGLLVSFVLPWVATPMGKAPRGGQFAFLQDIPALPHLQLGSYGVIGFAVFVLTMIAGRIDRRAVLAGGIALLALAFAAPLQIAFSNPDISRRLASEFAQQQNVSVFTTSFLPVNRGHEPETWTSLDFGTVWTRFVSAWYFLTLGWYVFTVVAAIVFFKAVALSHRSRLRALGLGALALLLFSALFLARPIAAHAQLDRAYHAQARGDREGAIALYRAAMRLDRWFALGPELYGQIGELHAALGILSSPEYHLYKGSVFENQAVQPSVTYEYQLAADAGGDLGIVGRREVARVAASIGLKLYGQRAYSGALAEWRQAFEEDPFQVQALFYAARAHFEAAQYYESVAAGAEFCKRSSNTLAMADVYSDMGDSFTKLDDHPHARECYALSFKLDYTLNMRGLGALTGE